jgi:hypothetical protein
MRITIHDEAGRRAVLYAIWERAATGIDERFYDRLSDEATAAINPRNDVPECVVTQAVTLLSATLLNVEEAKAAPVGATVNPSMPAGALRAALEACVANIEEDERGFWQSTQADRDHTMATHDAATRLLEELPEPAKAVA